MCMTYIAVMQMMRYKMYGIIEDTTVSACICDKIYGEYSYVYICLVII